MKKSGKKIKKEIILFSLILLIIILLTLYALLKFPPKVGLAYRIQFLQPHPLKNEIIEAIQSIDQSYLEGIHTIEIVDMFLDYDGLYILGGKIRLNVINEFKEEVLLHELKHHYCWKKERYLGHEGCFKEPPLLVEENVRDKVVNPVTEEPPNCFDSIQNQNEIDVDCGGPCKACEIETVDILAPPKRIAGEYFIIWCSLLTICIILVIVHYKKRNYERTR